MALIETAGNERKLLVHTDNALPHTAELSTQYFNAKSNEIGATSSILHPPSSILHTPYSILYTQYSPDLAPSGFYLFGYVKRCLAGFLFEDADVDVDVDAGADADQLLAAVEGVPEGIEKLSCKQYFSSGWTD
jgi:hypothetical protein